MKRNFLQRTYFLLFFLLFVFVSNAQNRTITGTVIGEDGESLPGVNVVIKGTTIGTITNMEGKFDLSVSNTADILVFSFIGMETKEVAIGNSQIVKVILKTTTIGVDEVVVVGYGTQKKSDITGTVASLPQKRLEMVPNIDVAQAIQGAIPGVLINTNSSGAAPSNENSTILIRGRNSIKANNDPLIVVDGVPYSGQLRDINPNDINSIEVLKDASSAAIYGSRGANGVILITTKSGAEGHTTISYDGYYSMQRLSNLPALMDGEEFYKFKTEREPSSITESEQEIYNNKAWVSWPDLALRNGNSQQHNLSVSGGTQSTKYYIAGNILNVHGIAINDDYLRVSTRINIDTKIRDCLSLGTRTALTYDDRSGVDASFEDIFWMNPLTKPYKDDGSINIYPWAEDHFFSNPLQGILINDMQLSYQVVTNNYLKIDIPFIKGLQYQINSGSRIKFTDSGTYRGRSTTTGYESQGSADVSRGKYYSTTLENIVSFNRDFGKHDIFLTGVYSFEENGSSINSLSADGFPHDILTWYSAAQANLIEPSFSYSKTKLISQMVRGNYSFDNRYLLTLTLRSDGYSGFGTNNKWGTFLSFAAGWNVANENFFTIKNVVNVLKLRASWGKNGNQAIGAYETISKLNSLDMVAGSSTAPGYVPTKLGEDNLGWESTESINIGLDFGVLSNRITGDINYYNSNTTGLLLDRSISPIQGITSVTQNIGKTNNKGLEISVNSNNISTTDFKWTTTGNIAFVKNKIVSLYGEIDENGKEIDDIANQWFIGQPIRVNYGYVFDGVWQEDEAELAALYGTKPGFIKIRDVNGDTLINADDRIIQGQKDPKFIWGMTNTLTYKNFTLSFFVHGIHGITKSNALWSDDVWTGVRRNTTLKNWWTPENKSNDWYMNIIDANKQGGMQASKYENASFIRLKDLTLSYDLSDKLLSKVNLKKIRFYVTGRNLLTITDWTGLDPELDGQRSIPLQKEYLIGLNIGF